MDTPLEGREKLLADPAASFTEPQEVLDRAELSLEEKRRILIEWERDARGLAVAEEEGLDGGEGSLLGRVRAAIRKLDEKVGETPPLETGHGTKHG